MLSLVVLVLVLVIIAVGRIGRARVAIWQAMTFGAMAVLLLGEISLPGALAAIDLEVMAFLFFMFILANGLVRSGYLFHLADRLFGRARTVGDQMAIMLFAIGPLSALLMNDTLAIVCTPLALHMVKSTRSNMPLIALAFAITTGSVMSPIGNPQNLLVASSVEHPFTTFAVHLAIPTFICLALTFVYLRWRSNGEFDRPAERFPAGEIIDRRMANACRLGLILLVAGVGARAALGALGFGAVGLAYLAAIAAAPLLLSSPRAVRSIDWRTLLFFISMFVLMGAVWETGTFQGLASSIGPGLEEPEMLVPFSLVMSQLLSNVPYVTLFLPLFSGSSTVTLMALAAGSTIAGNMLIIGAASNVIIVQGAERDGKPVGFLEFAKLGVPLALIQATVYILFLMMF